MAKKKFRIKKKNNLWDIVKVNYNISNNLRNIYKFKLRLQTQSRL